MPDGEPGEGVAAAQFELDRDVVAMMLNGTDADAKLRGDLAARQAVGDELQNAPLRRSELVERGFLFRQTRRARAARMRNDDSGADVLPRRPRPI